MCMYVYVNVYGAQSCWSRDAPHIDFFLRFICLLRHKCLNVRKVLLELRQELRDVVVQAIAIFEPTALLKHLLDVGQRVATRPQ